MNDLQKDILTAAVFITGLVGFISAEFIISSTLFASAAIVTNLKFNRKQIKAGQFWCYGCLYLNGLTLLLEDFQGLIALEVFMLYFPARIKPVSTKNHFLFKKTTSIRSTLNNPTQHFAKNQHRLSNLFLAKHLQPVKAGEDS